MKSTALSRFTITGTLILSCLAFVPAEAIDEDPILTAILSVKKKDENDKVLERQLTFTGKLAGFPVGTRIDIRFRLQGNRQHIAWYRALVDNDESIKGNSSLFRKAFAPGVYEVQFWLKIATQSGDLRKWFTVNRGWGRNHQELLENVAITLGDESDHKAFVGKCMDDLRAYLTKLDTVYKALAPRINNTIPVDDAWKKESVIHADSLSKVQQHFYRWERAHIAMPLEKYRKTINSIQVKNYKMLKAYNAGSTRLGQKLKFTEGEIRFLKDALSPAAPLEVPGDKKEEKKRK
jgi:hypothetical protein